ncbi:MAG: Uma2 family endonuclease [Gammaproteobacteria bacterium]
MSSLKKLESVSVEDYLEGEKWAASRHEYVRGAVRAMVGASVKHNLLAGGLAAAFRAHLSGTPCHVFQSDMKVRIGEVFYYPDLMITCGRLELAAFFQTAPTLIVEVLSQSTEAKDRLEKRVAYQELASLQEYVLMSQDNTEIEIIRRDGSGWEIETFGPVDTVEFRSIDFHVPIEDLYSEVVSLE